MRSLTGGARGLHSKGETVRHEKELAQLPRFRGEAEQVAGVVLLCGAASIESNEML